MKHFKLSLASMAGLFSLLFVPLAQADTWNHRTKLKFSGPVQLPGKVLPAGTYIFKLMDSPSDRHIVQVFNAGETQIEGTFLTIPDKRLKATGKTVIRFAERPAGSPEALKAWFYPGARVGEKFVYPHDQAAELAKANNEPVFATRSDLSGYMTKSMKSDQDSDAVEMRKAPVKAVQPNGEEIEIIEIYQTPASSHSK
ncbi:MAG: hypothetical protein M3Y27_06920 [Acidobacteriota bacterium]|nr:hypothetical protein [Acidobacteriota bacterium]